MAEDVNAASSPAAPAESSIADRMYTVPDAQPSAESAPAIEGDSSSSGPSQEEGHPAASEPAKPEATAKQGNNAETRIKQLVARTHALEAELTRYRQQSPPGPSSQDAPKTPPEYPDIGKYESIEDLRKAEREWFGQEAERIANEAVRKDRESRQQAEETQRADEYRNMLAKVWNERVAQARGRNADFDKAVFEQDGAIREIPLNPTMDEYLVDSEVGADMLYHLETHPELAQTIAALNGPGSAREMAKLEMEIADRVKLPRKSNAAPPRPPAQVPGTGRTVAKPKSAEEVLYG